jgi:hypothetical protein
VSLRRERYAVLICSSLLLGLAFACGEEEVSPEASQTPSTEGTPTSVYSQTIQATPAASESPLPPLTPIACPTGDCSRISMFMEGPSEVRSGDTVAYRLHYEVKNVPGTGVAIPHPVGLTYVSSRLVVGEGQLEWQRGYDRWSVAQGRGIIEFTLQIPTDSTVQTFTVGAYEPGTETTGSNTVTTSVSSQ